MVLIVANWKMNPSSFREAENLFRRIINETDKNKINIVICPPFLYLLSFKEIIDKKKLKNIFLGAQNVFWEEKGNFTGEISPLMFKNLNSFYVIIGHSERRKYLNETDEMIGKKLRIVLRNKFFPILCLGETDEERKTGKVIEVIKTQLENAIRIADLDISSFCNLILAYEPVWAIGTGNFCSPNEAMSIKIYLQKLLLKIFPNFGSRIRILYGGSVDSKNALEYLKVGFNGLLVGGVSLKEEFIRLLKNIS